MPGHAPLSSSFLLKFLRLTLNPNTLLERERERERESNASFSLPILTVENNYRRTVPLLNYFTRYDSTKSSLLRVAESALAEGVIFVMF
jgi:hypothetical protein